MNEQYLRRIIAQMRARRAARAAGVGGGSGKPNWKNNRPGGGRPFRGAPPTPASPGSDIDLDDPNLSEAARIILKQQRGEKPGAGFFGGML